MSSILNPLKRAICAQLRGFNTSFLILLLVTYGVVVVVVGLNSHFHLRILCSELLNFPDHLGSLGVAYNKIFSLITLVIVDHECDNSVIFKLRTHVTLTLECQESLVILYGLMCRHTVDIEEYYIAEDSCLAVDFANAAHNGNF